jgi:hypothetical protein
MLMGKQKQEAAPPSDDASQSAPQDEQSPYVISRGLSKMVIDVDLSAPELAAIDARIHAVMDMESQVQFHLDMFRKQLGERLKKLVARRLALHHVWKRGKGSEVIEVEVFQDDRTNEVRRVRVDTGETVTKRTLDQREQLQMFQGSGPEYLPELDSVSAQQFEAGEKSERDELNVLLADIDWDQIQASLAEQLGLTIEELAASAGDRSAKNGKKASKDDAKKRSKKDAKSEGADDSNGESEGGGSVNEEES